MQNKNTIKNWKIEITDEGAKLIITEGAVMARDVLNLAREQAIKIQLISSKRFICMMDSIMIILLKMIMLLFHTHELKRLIMEIIP